MPIRSGARMGANPSPGGITFRVWAPFAQSVAVAGDFNGWNTTANPLASEGDNGYWSGEIAGAAPGHRYKYYIVNGTGLWKNDPYAREIDSSGEHRNSVIHPFDYTWSGGQFQMPSWNELVIYELHVGSFGENRSSGGRFQDVQAKLPYLRDLGINAIEIMAAGEFTTDTSWGYNPAYIFAIEQSFGGINAFKAFVDAAHQHGIAVIMDVVYNHLGPEGLGHDGLWRFDGWSQGNYGGIYLYNDWRAWTPWGEKNRPDYGRGDVRWYLQENALIWLDHRHVDGLRWDATAYIRNVYANGNPGDDIAEGWSLMQWINDEIDRMSGWKISIAEDLKDDEWLTRETRAGGAGFDSQWDARFVHAVRGALTARSDGDRDMSAVAGAIAHRFNADAFRRVIYTESHDEVACGKNVRLPEAIWPGNAASRHARKRATLGAGIVFTAPGIPMIFQGQEFLEWGCWSDRGALDWSKAATFGGIANLYRDLIRLRRNWFDNTRGLRGQHVNVHHVNHTDKVLAFHRWDLGGAGDDVLIVLNMADRAYDSYSIGFPRAGLWKVRFNSDWNGYSADFGNHPSFDTAAQAGGKDGMPCSGNVGIGPYSLIILSQDR